MKPVLPVTLGVVLLSLCAQMAQAQNRVQTGEPTADEAAQPSQNTSFQRAEMPTPSWWRPAPDRDPRSTLVRQAAGSSGLRGGIGERDSVRASPFSGPRRETTTGAAPSTPAEEIPEDQRFLSAARRDSEDRARYLVGGTGGEDANQRAASFTPSADPGPGDSRTGGTNRRIVVSPDDPLVTGAITRTGARSQALPEEPAQDDNPWAPLGIRTGSLIWSPSVEILAGGTDNTARAATGGEAGLAYRVSPELSMRSDFARHELTASLRGSVSGYGSDDITLVPDIDASVNARIDLLEPTRVTLGATYAWRRESAGDADLASNVETAGDEHTFGLSAGITHLFRAVEASLTTAINRYFYTDSTLAGGGSSSNRDRERYEGTVGLRLAYADPVMLRPFVEGTVGLRSYDLSTDGAGYSRDATTYALRGGLIVDDPVLSGEVSAGLAGETAKDARLDSVFTWTFDGTLTWRASPLTDITITAGTDITATTLSGASAAIARRAGLSVSHDLRRNVEATLDLGATRTEYEGTSRIDDSFTAAAGVTYRMSRSLAVRGLVEHERTISTTPGSGFDATTVLAGVRLTR